jgi:hypothetical protein
MEERNFELKFQGRRKLNSSRRKTYYLIGAIELIIGLIVLLKSNVGFKMFFSIILIAGIANIIYGLIGKELRKEKNFISISSEEIEYKNSFQKPQKIKLSDLWDIRIETAKVEFVMNEERVKSYDFSVFQEQELEDIYGEFERVKAKLIK